MNKLLISAAIIGVAALSGAESAHAYGTGSLKCFGVATAGQNDCAAADGSHSCAGKATSSHNANDWIYVETNEQCWEKCGHVGAPGAAIPAGYCGNAAAPESGSSQGLNTMPVQAAVAPATGTTNTIPANAKPVGAAKAFTDDRDNH